MLSSKLLQLSWHASAAIRSWLPLSCGERVDRRACDLPEAIRDPVQQLRDPVAFGSVEAEQDSPARFQGRRAETHCSVALHGSHERCDCPARARCYCRAPAPRPGSGSTRGLVLQPEVAWGTRSGWTSRVSIARSTGCSNSTSLHCDHGDLVGATASGNSSPSNDSPTRTVAVSCTSPNCSSRSASIETAGAQVPAQSDRRRAIVTLSRRMSVAMRDRKSVIPDSSATRSGGKKWHHIWHQTLHRRALRWRSTMPMWRPGNLPQVGQ